jgi:hypothetical protein
MFDSEKSGGAFTIMKTFYCIIKHRKDDIWFDLIKDNIQAENKIEAREKVKQEFEIDIPMRLKLSDVKPGDLLLKLYEHDGKYFSQDFFEEKDCIVCQKKYTMTEKYNLIGRFGNYECCSEKCQDKIYIEKQLAYEYMSANNPVIYKITQISTNQCYIGKTEREFTLRWWEHIKGQEWLENILDFTFQVIEILPKKTETS